MEYNIIVNFPKEKNYYSIKDVLQKGRTIIDKKLIIRPVAEFLNIDQDTIIYDILTNNKEIYTYNIGDNTYHIIRSNLRQIENVTKNFVFELYCSVRRLLVDYFYPDDNNVDNLLNNSRNFQYSIFVLILVKLFIVNSKLFDSLIGLLVLGSLGFTNFMDNKVYTKLFELNNIYDDIEPLLASESDISKEEYEKVIDKMETHLKTFDFKDFSWLSDAEKTMFKQITNETNVDQSLKQKMFKTILTDEGFAKHAKKHLSTLFRLTKFMKKMLTMVNSPSPPPMLSQNLTVSATIKLAYHIYQALYSEFDETKYLELEKMLDKYEEEYGKTTETNKLNLSLFKQFIGL